jgi:hypothetical protein
VAWRRGAIKGSIQVKVRPDLGVATLEQNITYIYIYSIAFIWLQRLSNSQLFIIIE